jgi:signal transduction histidine kinase
MQQSPLSRFVDALLKYASHIACLLVTLLVTPAAFSQAMISVEQGVVDLSHWNREQEPVLKLDGQVRFYWSSFQVSSQNPSAQAEFIPIHGSWHRTTDHPLYGYATYEFDFISPEEQVLTLDFGTLSVAHRIYANGKIVDVNGNPQADRKSYTKGPARQNMITLILPKGRLQLAIEIANFEYMISGIVKPVVIGTPTAVFTHRYVGFVPALVLFGSYLGMALYHFGLFSLRRRDTSSLYFGLFCLAMLPSTVINMQLSVLELYMDVPLALGIYLASSFGIASGFLGLFIAYLYESAWSRRVSLVLLGFCGVLAVVQALDLQLYVILLACKFIIGLILAGFLTRTLYLAVRTGQQSSRMMLISCGLLICTAVNDFANFNNWINSTPLFSFGSLAFLMIQSYLLSVRFSNAFRQVKKSEREIRLLSSEIKAQHDRVVALNENLEQLAEEKTRDIRSIMTNIQLGIFAITPEGYAIHKDHSQYLCDVFELADVTGLNACHLLFDRSDLTSNEWSQAVSCLEASLGESELVFEMNAHGLPHELRYTGPSGQQKLLELSWNPMTNDQGVTEKILVTVKDITEIHALAEEAQDKREELELISELLNISSESFRRFLQNSHDFLAENRKLLNAQSIQSRDLEILKLLFINMHTMKGTSRSLYLKKMTSAFHDAEQYYAHLQKDSQAVWDLEKMNADLDKVEKVMERYVNIYQNKLNRKVSGEREIEVPESRIMQLYENFGAADGAVISVPAAQPFMRAMRAFFFESIFRSAHEVLFDICQFLGTLAKDLNKEKPVLTIETGGLALNHEGETLLRKIFIHLLRNTMDHGIETAEERLRKHKPVAGHITINLFEDAEAITLRYQDDGRGLDMRKIRAIATEKQLVTDPEAVTLEDIGELIFCAGLSTASVVNDISGRGVGMDAVRTYLAKVGGSIAIHLKEAADQNPDFCPFYFDMSLPRSLFAEPGKREIVVAA